MPNIDLSILNQRQTPAFYADVFANRPAAGFVGRIFVSTNTFAFYRDNGTSWDLIGGPGTGTITGSGTAGTIPLWSGASTIGDSDLRQLSSEALILNSATNDWPTSTFANDAGRFLITSATNNPTLILWGKAAFGSGDEQGSIALGNLTALGSTTFGGALLDGSIENGTDGAGQLTIRTTNTAGVSTLALTINSTQNTIFSNSIGINTPTPGAAIDAHSSANIIQQLNQTVATNNSLLAFQNSGAGLWRIGNFYNGGANDLGIFDVIGNIQPVTVKKTSGQVLIGTSTVGSGKLVVASATGDNGIQIVGATAPSLRIDNAESGPTKRAGFGLATAVNNFIQGSADRDFCMFNGSTTPSPILFGIYGTTNVQEAARISVNRNLIVGRTADSGERLQISGAALITSTLNVNGVGDFNTSISSTYDFAIRNTGTGNTRLRLGNSTSTARLTITLGATGSEFARIGPEGNFSMYFQTNGSDRLEINGSGDAIFSSSLRSNSHMIVSDGTSSVVLQGYINNALRIAVAGSGSSGGSRGDLYVGTIDGVTGNFSGDITIAKTVPILYLNATSGTTGVLYNTGGSLRFSNGNGTTPPFVYDTSTGDTSISAKLSIGNTVTASVNNVVTNKVAIVIGGVQYYLLASTSAV